MRHEGPGDSSPGAFIILELRACIEHLFDAYSPAMGWRNPPVRWSELERKISNASGSPTSSEGAQHTGPFVEAPSRQSPPVTSRVVRSRTRYAEMHVHSNFSFLDGASHPEELIAEAARLDIDTVALTDHDGFYGVVRFAEAARSAGIATAYGAELSLGLTKPQNGKADPEGSHLVVIARDPTGYAALGKSIAAAQMRGRQKGKPIYEIEHLAEATRGHVAILTGCRKGAIPRLLDSDGPEAARRHLHQLQDLFGKEHVFVEMWDHGQAGDFERNLALHQIASACGAQAIATNNVHFAKPSDARLANALAAVRSRRSLDEIDGWLPAAGTAHLRSGDEQLARFAAFPGVLQAAHRLGADCAFDLDLIAPCLPDFETPGSISEIEYLRQLTYEGAQHRYGPRHSERIDGAWAQLDHELETIESLGFPGYFLIVWDIVRFAKQHNIYCQGRGSAANSAVCYAIGITNVDPVGYELLFERFLSPERDGPPDIDVDIESDRREEVIQYVYRRYGRENASQVANVITYRPRSAVRDMAKAFGFSPGQQDAWSKQLDRWGEVSNTPDNEIPDEVIEMATKVSDFPRHLGIHSGGMVICDRPVAEVCPTEWARMQDRSVLQWDKEDCAAIGLVKFDLLGLGMLSAIHYAIDIVRDCFGEEVDLACIPHDEAVYDMLCKGDSLGVFQVESRAQIATLPRLRPRRFHDLVIQVALIRPGPIQGNAVHPFIRRHNGKEPITYLHPLLEPALQKTKGVPLFQEQLMQMAIDAAGFTASEADLLRQAISSKRSAERMEQLRIRLFDGMAANGIDTHTARSIYEAMAAFANFGFAESHAISFALLVYASAYLKHHWPAAFLAALLNAQPMGFWSPQSLVADAKRHGVTVHGPDVNASRATTSLEPDGSVRLGLDNVKGIERGKAETIEAEGPFRDAEDLARRCNLRGPQMEALATSGALASFGMNRREAIWAAGAAARSKPNLLPGIVSGTSPPHLKPMTEAETTAADLWSTGMSFEHSPMEFLRPGLGDIEVVRSSALLVLEPRSMVRVAGVVTHRQRPMTAQGVTFINLEDEDGHVNVVCSIPVWDAHRKVVMTSPALIIEGRLERSEGVVNVIASRIYRLDLDAARHIRSRDFH